MAPYPILTPYPNQVAPSLQAQAQLPVVFAFLKRALADDHEAVQAQFTEAEP